MLFFERGRAIISTGQKGDKEAIRFHRIYPKALPLLKADPSALSTLPTAAFQFCEPVRTASSYGWYVFPPMDLRLRWDGADVFYMTEDGWQTLSSAHLDSDYLDYWNRCAPEDLLDRAPPFLTHLFVPGVVQIWSGFLVSSKPGWSIVVRPPVNLVQNRSFCCFEGIVETDSFKPCPLFVNIKLISTEREIVLPKIKPLFQVQPLHQSSYANATLNYVEQVGLEPIAEGTCEGGMSEADWHGYRSTVRSVEPLRTGDDDHVGGDYGAKARRRRRREG